MCINDNKMIKIVDEKTFQSKNELNNLIIKDIREKEEFQILTEKQKNELIKILEPVIY